jgi:hypothetical protein
VLPELGRLRGRQPVGQPLGSVATHSLTWQNCLQARLARAKNFLMQ